MADAWDWERLAVLLDDDESVRRAVRAAAETGGDPWEVLLDALDEAGALAYLQADDTGMELGDALAQLPRVFAVQPDLDDVTDTDDLQAAMRVADRALAAGHLRLLRLVEKDDVGSWPVVAVPVALHAEIRALAEGLGQEALEA